MKRIATFEVTAELPPGCNSQDFIAYMRAAIKPWAGGGDPDAPLFGWWLEPGDDGKIPKLVIKKVPKK